MIPPGSILVLFFLPIGQMGPPSEKTIHETPPASANIHGAAMEKYPWSKPLLPGPVYSTRELVWKSDLILRIEPGPANSWKVLEILQKSTAKTDPVNPPVANQTGIYPRNAREWIGFWQQTPSATNVIPSGIRARNAEGRIWIPGGVEDLGEYDRMLESLRADIRAIGDLKQSWTSRTSPQERIFRQRKLLDWATANEKQFGGGIRQEDPPGWGSLEQDLLGEIMLGPDTSFSWEALCLYTRTNADHLPPLHGVFDDNPGRHFLLEKAAKGKLMGDRIRALRVLGNPLTWKTGAQEGQWENLGTILKEAVHSSNPELATAATATALGLGSMNRLDPALAKATWDRYLDMPLGKERGLMAAQLAKMAGSEEWKKRTGNDAAMVVGFDKLATMDDKIHWTLIKWEGTGGPSKLELVREKIDDSGMVKEVQSHPLLGADNLPWNPSAPLTGEWPIAFWPMGLWRVRIESKSNPAWKSEPRLIKVSKPLKLPIPGLQPLGTNNVVIDPTMPKSNGNPK